MDQQNYIVILTDTLQKQRDILQQILNLTMEQSRIAQFDEFDEVLLENSMNQKEVCIAKLNELDAGFTSVYGRVRNAIRKDPESYQKEIRLLQSLIKQCTDLGVEIRVMETRNKEKLTRCFAEKHKEYAGKKNAATVASCYSKVMNQSPYSYFSKKN